MMYGVSAIFVHHNDPSTDFSPQTAALSSLILAWFHKLNSTGLPTCLWCQKVGNPGSLVVAVQNGRQQLGAVLVSKLRGLGAAGFLGVAAGWLWICIEGGQWQMQGLMGDNPMGMAPGWRQGQCSSSSSRGTLGAWLCWPRAVCDVMAVFG